MRKTIIAGSLLCLSIFAQAHSDLRPIKPSLLTVQEDFRLILEKASLTGKIDFNYVDSHQNDATIECRENKMMINVKGDHQWSQTFYMALQRLGFLFPHPRIQVSPTFEDMQKQCGKSFSWKPATKYSGFHLHTMHPNEWAEGFLSGKEKIAIDFIRWLARNQQNIFDLSLLRQPVATIFKNMRNPFALAKRFGIHSGIALGIALQQQNSYKLVTLLGTFSDSQSAKQIYKNLNKLITNIDVSFINLEMGTSEFTSINYDRQIKWMNQAAAIAEARGVKLLVKAHVSTNQVSPQYGNFNFLAQYADTKVGILPHTVYLYSLEDESAPMYGNKNFKHMLEFMLQEKDKRRTWFYPETSYFVALDIDAPLLLTEYLVTRASDTKLLFENNVEGQINFTTGHELGYWLFDWTYTLQNNQDYHFDPLIGLKLLGEDEDSWSRILHFQTEYFKEKSLVSIITFQNFGDEIMPNTHQTLKRNTLKQLDKDKNLLSEEIARLKDAIAHIPKNLIVKNQELKDMLEVTFLRMHHALKTRQAFFDRNRTTEYLNEAAAFRKQAQERIDRIVATQRYPEALIFEQHLNVTSYHYGYGYTAKTLHYWKREEEVIRKRNFSPFFMNITNFLDIIF